MQSPATVLKECLKAAFHYHHKKLTFKDKNCRFGNKVWQSFFADAIENSQTVHTEMGRKSSIFR